MFYRLHTVSRAEQVPVKQMPDHESATVSALTKKDLVEILWHTENAWSKVRIFADWYEWYVLTWQLEPVSNDLYVLQKTILPNFTNEIPHIIKKYADIPYLRWGKSYEWIDCSWLVQQIYADYGIHLPRDASQQALVSYGSTISNLQYAKPGDLVFFHSNGKTTISHVWILVDQNHVFHAWQWNGFTAVDAIDERGIIHHTGEIHNYLSSIKRIIAL